MNILILLYFITVICGKINSEKQKLTIDHGVIEVQGYKHCTIMNNNFSVEYNGPTKSTIPGFWFGLIKYHCDNVIDSIISELRCKECGFYCIYNQYIEGCQQKNVEFWIGLLIGLITSSIILSALIYLTYHGTEKFVYLFNYCMNIRSDKKTEREAERINMMTGIETSPMYKERLLLTEKHREKLQTRRNNKSREEAKFEEMIEMKDVGNEVSNSISLQIDEESHTDNKSKDKQPQRKTEKVYPSLTNLAVTALLMSDNSYACDMNLYLSGTNKICTSTSCYDINVFNFPIMSGQTVCFKDNDGEVFEAKMSAFNQRTRYNLMYYTSDFNGSSSSLWDCGEEGFCSATKSDCKKDFVHPDFKDIKGGTVVQGYGCRTVVTKCDSYCWRDGSCSYYHWWIKPLGNMYPVYKAIGRTWEVQIVTTYRGIVETHNLGTNQPTKNLEGLSGERVMRIPVAITSFMVKDIIIDNGLIVVEDKAYMVDISGRNMPQHNMIGDYQISIAKDQATYDEGQIDCIVNHCKAECSFPKPKVRHLVENIKSQRTVKEFSFGISRENLDSMIPVQGTIMTMIGNVEFRNLHVEKAECDIDIAMTYGCVSCEDEPYIVFNSYNVKTQGIVPFESNCSFERRYLSCNMEPYVLTMTQPQKYCYIHIIESNKTLYVEMDYKYLGTLTPSKMYSMKDDTISALKHIATSDEFIKMVGNTALYCSIIGTTLTITVRIINLYMYKRAIEKGQQ